MSSSGWEWGSEPQYHTKSMNPALSMAAITLLERMNKKERKKEKGTEKEREKERKNKKREEECKREERRIRFLMMVLAHSKACLTWASVTEGSMFLALTATS